MRRRPDVIREPRNVRVRLATMVLALLVADLPAVLAGCVETLEPEASSADSSAVVSDPAPNAPPVLYSGRAAPGVSFSDEQAVPGTEIAYVSLPPGGVPNGEIALISGPHGSSVTVAMIDGGFDPVPIVATAGDTVHIEIRLASGGSLSLHHTVPVRRRPRVVRTVPPRGKRDVALNATIVVVFSEPVNLATLSSSSVQLFRGQSAVAGTIRSLEGDLTSAVFEPSALLAANTQYRLVVTQAVTDLDGDALEGNVTVEFTTGTAVTASVSSVTITPDSANLSLDSQFWLRATARDRFGAVINGRPIAWSSDDPQVAAVSVTGLVTARADGVTRIRAAIDGQIGSSTIVVSGLRVTAATTGVDLPERLAAVIWRVQGSWPMGSRIYVTGIHVPANGSMTVGGLAPDVYHVELSAEELSANCNATGPTLHTVTMPSPVEVQFKVQCEAA